MDASLLLLIGLALFIGIHALPWVPGLRAAVYARLGAARYRTAFTLAALAGLVLAVIGYARAGTSLWYLPPDWGRSLNPPLVLAAMILLPAAHMKSNIKRFTRHPMLWGVVLWALAHLLVRGDAKSVILFGSLAVYALLAMVSANLRGAELQKTRLPLKHDLIVVAAGLGAFIVLALIHRWLFGVPALPWSL